MQSKRLRISLGALAGSFPGTLVVRPFYMMLADQKKLMERRFEMKKLITDITLAFVISMLYVEIVGLLVARIVG